MMQMSPVLSQGRQEYQIQREDVRTEMEIREKRICYSGGFEDEGRGSIKECRQPVEAGKVKEMDSYLELPEGIQAC